MKELTKDADILIRLIYKEYLERRKNGMNKADAKSFSAHAYPESFKQAFSDSDLRDTLNELEKHGFVEQKYVRTFYLTDTGIVQMEQRFPNGIKEILDGLGKICSLIPGI